MSLEKKEVERIAQLAKLGITEKEKQKYQKELSSILNFVEKLNQVKIDQVEPLAHVTGVQNVTREDIKKQKTKTETDKLVNQFPIKEKRQVKVKAVL